MPRILFVAPVFSPLAARWIMQLSASDWDIHIFSFAGTVHPHFHNVTVHQCAQIITKPTLVSRLKQKRILKTILAKLKRFVPRTAHPVSPEQAIRLAEVIKEIRPDCIHSLRMQNEGYLVSEAKNLLGKELSIPWIHSLWGSDILYFGQLREHQPLIRKMLTECEYLMADNERDFQLAINHGFKGNSLGIFPGGGGYPTQKMWAKGRYTAPSQRRIIAVKGYQTEHGGQALTALDALLNCGVVLAKYKIVIHSAIDTYASHYFSEVKTKADEVSRYCGVEIEFLPYSPIHAIWELFGMSRLAIAISNSDGTPNTLLEAMIMGAYPIQSDTGGLSAWIEDRVNGSLVPYNDIEAISKSIRSVIDDDLILERAAQINRGIAEKKLDEVTIRDHVVGAYQTVLANSQQQL